MKSNSELKKDVEEELKWEPSLMSTEIVVSVDKGVITLSGIVDSLLKKQSAVDTTNHVPGVKFVTDKIEVKTQKTANLKPTTRDSKDNLSNPDDSLLKISGA